MPPKSIIIQTNRYNFDFTLNRTFSNFIAAPMSPLIFSFPVMKAVVGFSCPEAILTKSSAFKFIVQDALLSFGAPLTFL